jgi:hypothetical protein
VEEPVVDVQHMAFVGAIVRDPVADGDRLAEVLDANIVTYEHGDALDVPHRALDLGDCMLALYPIPPDAATSVALWGGVHERPRCLTLGLTARDQGVAERALDAASLTVHHRTNDGRAVYVDMLPFPVVLGDSLLPGDPRLARGKEDG